MEEIIQGSPQWLQIRQETIGGSESYCPVYHYCRNDLVGNGFKEEELIKDRPFRTIQELFLKVKFNAQLSEIDPVHKVFGNALEEYTAYRFAREYPEIDVRRTKEFLRGEGLASCSPDGYLNIKSGEYDDYDKTCKINSSWGEGLIELKTANFFSKFLSGGSKLQYIVQLQHNLMVAKKKWGCLTALLPKEKEIEIDGVKFPTDDPFVKGKTHTWAQEGKFEMLDNIYDLQIYIYPVLPFFQTLIIKSLNAFQADLNAYDTDQSRFPRNSEDLAGLQREKALWAQLWPEKFGTLEIDQNSKLNRLLDERYQAQVESMFADQTQKKIECEINQLIQQEKLGKYTELKGSDNRMIWTKNGQVRFYKINNK